MKVSNNRIGSPQPGIDAGKTGKTDTAGALSKDVKAGALNNKEAIKNSAKVDVSDRAQMMQKAKDIATSTDTVDEAKVARLQKLIDEGKYKTDAAAIADKLVDQHLLIPD
ncbi:MAG: flagellar biosynthesis anti-sigma factor FlgM [Bdellovibrionales bacterium]|nr:flagellar biosynthesis anti-sigma factor FlgM [Bdellovibrionales bacterium]